MYCKSLNRMSWTALIAEWLEGRAKKKEFGVGGSNPTVDNIVL